MLRQFLSNHWIYGLWLFFAIALLLFFLIRPAMGKKNYAILHAGENSSFVNIERPYYPIPRDIVMRGVWSGRLGWRPEPRFAASRPAPFLLNNVEGIAQFFIVNQDSQYEENVFSVSINGEIFEAAVPEKLVSASFYTSFVPLDVTESHVIIITSDLSAIGPDLALVFIATNTEMFQNEIVYEANHSEWVAAIQALKPLSEQTIFDICKTKSKSLFRFLSEMDNLRCD